VSKIHQSGQEVVELKHKADVSASQLSEFFQVKLIESASAEQDLTACRSVHAAN
jgi:hypothetical protein